MNETVSVRFCEDKDLIQISEIEKECFSKPWSLNALTDFYNNEYSDLLVASEKENICGYITFTKMIDTIQIANVAVKAEYRRCGIGEKLIDTLIAYGKECGFDTITLEVRQSNNPALNLYTKKDFKKVGEIKNYYSFPRETAIFMNYTFQS